MSGAAIDLQAYLYALAVLVAMSVVTWLVSVLRRNAGVVDSVVTVPAGVRVVLCVLRRLAWPARLDHSRPVDYLGPAPERVHHAAQPGQPEDRRYAQIRANNQPHFELKSLFIVFLLQAALAWVISLPLHAGILGSGRLNLCDALGIALVVFGIGFETIADLQLARFKARPTAMAR